MQVCVVCPKFFLTLHFFSNPDVQLKSNTEVNQDHRQKDQTYLMPQYI